MRLALLPVNAIVCRRGTGIEQERNGTARAMGDWRLCRDLKRQISDYMSAQITHWQTNQMKMREISDITLNSDAARSQL